MRVVLSVLASLYGAGIYLRRLAYRSGIFSSASLPGFVLSVGNLTTGGTGKTPAVITIARWAIEKGYKVAVLSRGYGGRYSSEVLEVSDGYSLKAEANDCGDEPLMLAGRLPGVPVIVSKKRYHGGMYASKRFGSSFFILDDGFQHLELKRDFDLVLIDASTVFGNGRLLPRGPLREPISALSRADAIVLTRAASAVISEGAYEIEEGFFQTKPVFYADHIPEKVIFPFTGQEKAALELDGRTVVAFAGVARPRVFENTLKGLGARILGFRGYRDHYGFSRRELRELIELRDKVGAEYLLTTEKDWARVSGFVASDPAIGYLSIEFHLLAREASFFEIIKNSVATKDLETV